MSKVVLISDINTEIGYNLLKQFYVNGYRILGFTTDDPKKLSLKEFKNESIEIMQWNRSSPVGIKNLLLRGVTKFQAIDELLLLQSIRYDQSDWKNLSSLDINRETDKWIKGNLLLLKEFVEYFGSRGTGLITLVNHAQFEEGNYPLGELIEAGLKVITKNLFKLPKEYNIRINTIESHTAEYLPLCEYIFDTINEKARKVSGKIFTYSEKKGLFGSFNR